MFIRTTEARPFSITLATISGSGGVVIGGNGAQNNAFIDREEFFPYGETSFGSFGKKRYRFVGKEHDGDCGLSYFGARYFASHLVRWISTRESHRCRRQPKQL